MTNQNKLIVPIEPKTNCAIKFKKIDVKKALFNIVPAQYKTTQFNKLIVKAFNLDFSFPKIHGSHINGLTFLISPLASQLEELAYKNKISLNLQEIQSLKKEIQELIKSVNKMQPFYFAPYKIRPFTEIKNLDRQVKEKLLLSHSQLSEQALSFSDFLSISNDLAIKWNKIYKAFIGISIDPKKSLFTLIHKNGELNITLSDIDKTIKSMLCPQDFAYTQDLKKDWFFTNAQAQEISLSDDMKDFLSTIEASSAMSSLKSIPLCFVALDRIFSRSNKISYKEKVHSAKLSFPTLDNLKIMLSIDCFEKQSRFIFDPLGLEFKYGKLERFILTRQDHCADYVHQLNIVLSKIVLEDFFETIEPVNPKSNSSINHNPSLLSAPADYNDGDKTKHKNKVSKI